MVTKESSRRERKHAALRARIISTGIDIFSRHGIANVTVDHIADMADIGKGTIYNYFPTKEDIVVAYMVDLEPKIQAKVRQLSTSKKSLESILNQFIKFQFRLKKPYHRFVRVFLSQMFSRTEHFIPYLIEMQKAIDPPLEALFQGLQDGKLIRKDLDIKELAGVFKTMHLGLTALWAIEGPPFRGTYKTLQQEMKLFCEGIKGEKT